MSDPIDPPSRHQLDRAAHNLSIIADWNPPRLDTHPHMPGKKCDCGHSDWALLAFIKADATRITVFACANCGLGGRGSWAVSKTLTDPDFLPVVADKRAMNCPICGFFGVQLHHYAPRHLFGDAADKWPTGYLCRSCHRVWHDKVTPNMTKKQAA